METFVAEFKVMRLDDQRVNEHLAEQLKWSERQKNDIVDDEVSDILRKSNNSVGLFISAVLFVVVLLVLWFLRDAIWPNRFVP